MAISTYSELQAAIASWLDRDDLSGWISNFISAAEHRIADDVKLRAMEAPLSEALLTGAREISYPATAIQLKGSIYVVADSYRYPLTQKSEQGLLTSAPNDATTTTGKPSSFYLTADDKLRFDVYADDDYTIEGTYYQRLVLSDISPTNWLLTNYPMALLYASMIEALTYIEDDPRRYEMMYEEQLARLRRMENRDRYSAGPRTYVQVSL